MRVVAIIQARLGSKRLPGKILAPIDGKPLLQHVIDRALLIKGVDDVCLNTPESDLALITRALVLPTGFTSLGIANQETDVLKSFVTVAEKAKADVVMRLTGDCPLLDPQLCTSALTLYLAMGMAVGNTGFYCANDTLRSGYPDGTDCEVVSAASLRESARETTDPYEREHVTIWLRKHVPCYSIMAPYAVDLSQRKWSVDTDEDLARVQAIVKKLKPGQTDWRSTRDAEDRR
jgi:spore coat polysaccharide biosynthesis protein SpsF (cytidylyltransferase family)